MYKNLCTKPNGATVVDFTSQYHHESRALNILLRDPTFVWFSSYTESLPQSITLKFDKVHPVGRVGIYLHGENNQNPKTVEFYLGKTIDDMKLVKSVTLEHRAGDHFWDLDSPVEAEYIKLNVTENFGGSGIYVSKLFAFEPTL